MSQGKSDSLTAAIAQQLAAATLPGEAALTAPQLAEAADFLRQTAAQRKAGKSAIAIDEVPCASGARLMRIAVVSEDMPFIVDSLAAAIAAQGFTIERLLHPVVPVRGDGLGLLTQIPARPGGSDHRESMIYGETSCADARDRSGLRKVLEAALADVRAAVTDWPAMRDALAGDAEFLARQAQDSEGAELLHWLHGGMLTQLGHVVRKRDGSQSGALGICRKGMRELLAPASYKRAFAWFDRLGKRAAACAPLVIKANQISQVHRRVPLDLFIVPRLERGRSAALSVHAGIWTSAALAAPPETVPRLRTGLAALADKLGFAPTSHDGKALVHALTALPHDLLVGFDSGDLERVATAMISLIDRPRSKLLLVRAPLDRHLFAFVWLPRDAVSTTVRQTIGNMLESATRGQVLDWSLEVEGGNLALLRFVLDVREGPSSDGGVVPDEAALDHQLQAMLRGWVQAVEGELVGGEEPGRAAMLAARYADAFPLAYRATYGPADAASDIARLQRLPGGEGIAPPRRDARLHHMSGDAADRIRLKIYENGGNLTLSDAVPVLENFGFEVIENVSTTLAAGRLGGVDDFLLTPPAGAAASDLLARAAEIEAAIAAVLNGEAESVPFNRLILTNRLTAREAGWLRGWYRYLRQAGMRFGSPTVVEALQNAPLVTRGILDLFIARHDPQFARDRARAEAAAQKAIREGLTEVAAINDDRLLRQLHALVEAMLRTNAFLPSGDAALAFKLDSSLIPGLPVPVPWREIFVFSPQVEGIHLRAGPVARGGLRWSDRRDDFRTEVLGLMKAQRVKNGVIVPTGAKGGFYAKRLPDPAKDRPNARDAWLAEGKASYQTFVRALLSLTDNIVGGAVVHPEGMVVRDGDDPYFVVAADKGTATYSDTANAIAAEAYFWLGDAFASGGSKGYDHKAMGITARGAWTSVQRHFRELGTDVQSDPVRVAGCGDMSGDVFGNGMLLSKSIRLVAAFDHRHIFLDPDPDPAASWAERARLFALPRSSWDDYDKSLISKGGGVFPRSLKAIPLSPQVRDVLGIAAESADPETLISAILRSPVDLLWFGGIGTYVKGSAENNIEVGDHANDALRVDGAELRARVVGEGANLGCTQAARIEFALNGGRINTDFIDNSAGVDCSDKEVNIKIALASARRDGRITEPARVRLLGAMTEDVAALVLEDNRLQTLALSVAQTGGPAATGSYLRLIDMLEDRGQLDRKSEGLADSETLLRRAADGPGEGPGEGQGLTRPELAVLLSCTKLALQKEIEDSLLPGDPGLEGELFAAFPAAMRSKFKADIAGHRLRREIIATRIANRMVNRIGMIHPFELTEEEGAGLAQVAAAFVAAEQLFGMGAVWQAIEQAAMPEGPRILLLRRAASALRTHMADLLRAGVGAVQPSALVTELASGVSALSQGTDKLLGGEARLLSARLRSELAASGAPEREADLVAHLAELDGAVGLARLARESQLPLPALTHAFSAIGSSLGLDWVQGVATLMRPIDPWERLLTAGLARDFQQIRLEYLRRICGGELGPQGSVAAWVERHADTVRQFRAMVARAQTGTPVTPAMLAQIAGQARKLLAR